MSIKKHIPNTLTCCNLLCGATAILLATQQLFIYAFICILFGAVFDLFDGMVARLLHVSGPLGLQLDSLADDITFGLAPSLMLYFYLQPILHLWSLLALPMAAFSALRLAKFNIDDRQRAGFIGLATPANAIFWCSICCLPELIDGTQALVVAIVLIGFSLFSCYLLLAEVPFFSFKFHSLQWKENSIPYTFLIIAVLLILGAIITAVVLKQPHLVFLGSAATIVVYVLMNITLMIFPKR